MKKLYLDVGNTSFSIAEKKYGEWSIRISEHIKYADEKLRNEAIRDENVTVITSSVRKDITKVIQKHFPEDRIRVLKSADIPDKYLDYNTPETLGMDRFLTCIGAVTQFRSGAIVVDAGSACTIDFMTADKIYQGGVIMPGIQLYHRTVARDLPELPPVNSKIPDSWPGKTTKACIQWGINGAYFQSVKMFVEKFKQDYPDAAVAVTGGDAEIVNGYLANSLAVHYKPELIFDGMAAFLKLEAGS